MVWSKIPNWQVAVDSKSYLTIDVMMSTSLVNIWQMIWLAKFDWQNHWEVMYWCQHPCWQIICQSPNILIDNWQMIGTNFVQQEVMIWSQHPYLQLTDAFKFCMLLTSHVLMPNFVCQIMLWKYMYIKHKRLCFTRFPNTKNRVENMSHSGDFLTNFEVFVPVVKGYSTIADATFRHNVWNLIKRSCPVFHLWTHMLTQLYNTCNSNWLMFMSENRAI